MASSHWLPCHPTAQVHLSGAEHCPCGPHADAQMAWSHSAPRHPSAQVHALGAEHFPWVEHWTLSQMGVEQSLPDQPVAQEQVSGATHFPLAPQPEVPLLRLLGKQIGNLHVSPRQPFAHVHLSGAVHFPLAPHGDVQDGTSHLPGGPIPFSHVEQSSVPQPWAHVQVPVPELVPLPSHVPWPEQNGAEDDAPGHGSQFAP